MQVPISREAAKRSDVPEPYLLMAAATMNKLGRLVPGVAPQPGALMSSRKINRVSEQTNPNVSPNA